MKKVIGTVTILLIVTNVIAQKTEVGISLNSGLFSFTGKSADEKSAINYNDQSAAGYTNNPYGSKPALSYGLSANLKRISKAKLIAGLDVGYEKLRSKISIDRISGYTGTSTYQVDANGRTILTSNALNIHPFIGYRFSFNKVYVDLTGGLDVAYLADTREDGKATTSSHVYETSVDRHTIKSDIRPRLQVSLGYRKFNFYIGQSAGLSNYKLGYVGGANECFARITRFGLSYSIL